MRLFSVAMTAGLIMAGLIGCASSHTKPRHEYRHYRQAYPHATRSSGHGHHGWRSHAYPRVYRRPPPPAPGRTPDGRYVLPGGLESVCAGGTPPPCQ